MPTAIEDYRVQAYLDQTLALDGKAPDGIEWGVVETAGGQNCRRWVKQATEGIGGIDWFLSPADYLKLVRFWEEHHLKGFGQEGFAQTPDWIIKLSEESPSLEGAFLHWWWRLYFGKEYEEGLRYATQKWFGAKDWPEAKRKLTVTDNLNLSFYEGATEQEDFWKEIERRWQTGVPGGKT